jgi:hypothetical protein
VVGRSEHEKTRSMVLAIVSPSAIKIQDLTLTTLLLNRIAAALNQRVEIRFVPAEQRLRSA